MANAVDICNYALANLGDSATVTSINPPEGSAQAERCQRFYPMALAELLEEHDWSFASVREKLTAYADNPREHWRFCYAVPSRCVKIINIVDSRHKQILPQLAKGYYDYEIGLDKLKRKVIFTNIENAWINYVSHVDEALFPMRFVEALAWKLSAMLAGPMIKGTEGSKMALNCEEKYQYALRNAKLLDAEQHRDYQENIPEWIVARRMDTYHHDWNFYARGKKISEGYDGSN